MARCFRSAFRWLFVKPIRGELLVGALRLSALNYNCLIWLTFGASEAAQKERETPLALSALDNGSLIYRLICALAAHQSASR